MSHYPQIPSPAFVLEEELLRRNLELIRNVQHEAGVEIILALKAFAFWRVFPMIAEYLSGATASSLNEARLIYEEMGCKAHTYCVAYLPGEFDEIVKYSSHLTFNSIAQYQRFRGRIPEGISCGIRVNPEYSEVEVELYNPAAPGSRLGEVETAFDGGLPEGIEGLHFHTLCESSSYDLEKVLAAFEQKFAKLIPHVKWVNMGGGHLMTRKDYNTGHLISLLRRFREKWGVQVILEPGSAIAWQTGPLIATVLDVHQSRGIRTAIVDVSFTCHMPDTLEMPYKPHIRGASQQAVEGWYPCRIGGVSCLAGDYMSEYFFEKPLQVGDRIILEDMIHYTLVKTTMFNGVHHPDIYFLRENGQAELMRRFDYLDYRNRMG